MAFSDLCLPLPPVAHPPWLHLQMLTDVLTTAERRTARPRCPVPSRDNLTACLCIYLARMENENSFNLLPARSREALPGVWSSVRRSRLWWGQHAALSQQGGCWLALERALVFRGTIFTLNCPRAESLHNGNLQTEELFLFFCFFFQGAHISVDNWIEVFKNGHIMQFGPMSILDFSN